MEHLSLGIPLCERCSLLRFDDLVSGCREVVDKDGMPRLSFENARVEWHPRYYEEEQVSEEEDYDYEWIRLNWQLDDSLPSMPQLSRSSQMGCDFCKSLRICLQDYLVEQSRYYTAQDGPMNLTAYLSLREEDVEGIVVEAVFNDREGVTKEATVYFPLEASPGQFIHINLELQRLTLS
jgi:hypothetical protein